MNDDWAVSTSEFEERTKWRKRATPERRPVCSTCLRRVDPGTQHVVRRGECTVVFRSLRNYVAPTEEEA